MSGQHLRAGVPLLAVLASCWALARGGNVDSVFDFKYDHGGEDWLSGECADRDRQSPINFGFEAPWTCAPPLNNFLRSLLGDKEFRARGFAKLMGGKGGSAVIGGAPAPGPALMAAPSPAAMLEVDSDEEIRDSTTTPPVYPGCNGKVGAFFFHYDEAEKSPSIQNNGHSISTDLKGHGLGGITYEDTNYDVLSVNFHVYSEHRFAGKQMPLELHIVHRQPETEHIIVVAVPFNTEPPMDVADQVGKPSMSLLQHRRAKMQRARGRQGVFRRQRDPDPDHADVAEAAGLSDAEAEEIVPKTLGGPPEPKPTDPGFSDALANLMIYPLPKDGQIKEVPLRHGPTDLISPLLGAGLMPEAYFKYEGSLTAPPCTEQVTWLVRKEPLTASRSQIELLRVAILQANSNYPNSRSPMPLMGRGIYYHIGIKGEAPPPPPRPVRLGTGTPEHSADFRGVALGKDAVKKALEAAQAKNQITVAVTQAQQVRAAMASTVDAAVAAGTEAEVAASAALVTTPLPTANPEMVLSRIVDAVAEQMDGAEASAAMAAAGVAFAPPTAAAPR